MNQKMIFKIGNVVRLKSGGPKMSVVAADDFHAVCEWYDANKESLQHQYPHEALDLVPSLGDIARKLS